jgi:hypothetical protein
MNNLKEIFTVPNWVAGHTYLRVRYTITRHPPDEKCLRFDHSEPGKLKITWHEWRNGSPGEWVPTNARRLSALPPFDLFRMSETAGSAAQRIFWLPEGDHHVLNADMDPGAVYLLERRPYNRREMVIQTSPTTEIGVPVVAIFAVTAVVVRWNQPQSYNPGTSFVGHT